MDRQYDKMIQQSDSADKLMHNERMREEIREILEAVTQSLIAHNNECGPLIIQRRTP